MTTMRLPHPNSLNRSPSGSMVGHSIDNGNLQFVKLIGVGTYGEVYHTVDRQTGESYAVKVLSRKPASPNTQQWQLNDQPFVDARLLSREVALYARIPRHNNIIRLERMLHTPDQIFMVMEYTSGGDLYENITSNRYFKLPGNDALIRRLFLQLVSAIHHCHKHGVYHRDIKPENVLVSRDGLNVKLIDFGLSTSEPWCREIGCGSAYYMSPECQGGIYTRVDQYAAAPNDVWALGIILINLATGRNPWNRAHLSDPLFNRFLRDKAFLCRAIGATPAFEHIIRRTLDVNASTRCSLDELYGLVKNCTQFVAPVQQLPSPPVHTPVASKATAISSAVGALKTSQHPKWFSSGLASPHSPATNEDAAHRHMQQTADRHLQPSANCKPEVRVAQQPAQSLSFSSADSIFDPFVSTNQPFGYLPFNTPGLEVKAADTAGTPLDIGHNSPRFFPHSQLACAATNGN
ncbi:Serine/threonine protein kinase [Coemansia sp. RSA 1821]|nr:Serine/threonine protein kinase [Coemansia sp. RSA 1821]